MNHLSLADRILWEDGTITVPADDIASFIDISEDGKLFTDHITSDIEEFNKLCNEEFKKIKIKESLEEISTDWVIPKHILDIDIELLFQEKMIKEAKRKKLNKDQVEERIDRLYYEYEAFKERDLEQLIYTILYIINRFESSNTVWGVGRGSSVSSYLLYILGIHDIDSVEYDLDFNEFIQ